MRFHLLFLADVKPSGNAATAGPHTVTLCVNAPRVIGGKNRIGPAKGPLLFGDA